MERRSSKTSFRVRWDCSRGLFNQVLKKYLRVETPQHLHIIRVVSSGGKILRWSQANFCKTCNELTLTYVKCVLLLLCVLLTLNDFLCLYRNAFHGSLLTLHEDKAWKTWGGVMAGWDKLGDQEAPENLTPTLQTGDVLQERGLLLPFLSAEQG